MLGWECYCVCVMEDNGCWDGSVITVCASWKIRDVRTGVLLCMRHRR
jgi:hypothetical protein